MKAGLERIDVEALLPKMWIVVKTVVLIMMQTQMIVRVCFAFIVIGYKLLLYVVLLYLIYI